MCMYIYIYIHLVNVIINELSWYINLQTGRQTDRPTGRQSQISTMQFAPSNLPATINNERVLTVDIVGFASISKPQAKIYEEYINK